MKNYAKAVGTFAFICALFVMSCVVQAGQFSPDETDDTPVVTLTMPEQPEQEDSGGHWFAEEAPQLKLHITPSEPLAKERQVDTRDRSYTRQENRRADERAQRAEQRSKNRKPERRSRKHETQGSRTDAHQSGPYEISGVRIVDIHSGRVMPIDKVDLKPTIDRIAAGVKNPHRNDGSIFRNLSRNLPRKSRDYYREYVVPTEGIRGPGPQRLIIGQKGEIYYTYDHYDSFIKVEGD